MYRVYSILSATLKYTEITGGLLASLLLWKGNAVFLVLSTPFHRKLFRKNKTQINWKKPQSNQPKNTKKPQRTSNIHSCPPPKPQPQTRPSAQPTVQYMKLSNLPKYIFLYKWNTMSKSFANKPLWQMLKKNNNSSDGLFIIFPHRSLKVSCIFIATEVHSSQLPLLTTAFPACSCSLPPFVALQSCTVLKDAKSYLCLKSHSTFPLTLIS